MRFFRSNLGIPAIALLLFTAFAGLIYSNFRIKTKVVINGKTYYARGSTSASGNCITFTEWETNELTTICNEFHQTPSASPVD